MHPEMNIYERLVKILEELPAIGKDARNEQQKFMYRSHDAVLNALNPLLAKYGVFVVPHVLHRISGTRETRSGSTMYEVNLHVEFTFWGEKGDYVRASAWGEGTDSGDKSTNKAMTMAFKNVLAQTFAISTADTVDSDGEMPEETVRPFDPATDLLPRAIEGEGYRQRISQALTEIEPNVVWGDVLDQVAPGWRELKDALGAEFWRRLSNTVARLRETFEPGSFPPPDEQQIQQAFAEMFLGVTPSIVYKQPEGGEENNEEPPGTASDAA